MAEKAPKGVKTTFHIWALSEEDAKENLALNGWKILEINKINLNKLENDSNYQDNSNMKLKATSVSLKDENNKNNSDLLKYDNKAAPYYDYNNFKNLIDGKKLEYVAEVKFETGKYTGNYSNLDNINFNDNKTYFLYGNADSLPVRPNNMYRTNYELSILRAKEVKNYLIKAKSLNEENLKIVGFGEFYPKKDNGFEGNPENRRVEIYELK